MASDPACAARTAASIAAVVEEGNLTRGAQRCNLAPSSVSAKHEAMRACSTGSTLIFWDHRFRTQPPASWLESWKPVTNLPPDRVPFYHCVHAYTKS